MDNQQALSKENALQTKLDETWDAISKEKVIDFLRRTVTRRTTIGELLKVLSYDKVQQIKEQLGDVPLSEVIVGGADAQAKEKKNEQRPLRQRTAASVIEQELDTVLHVIRTNPGISRGEIAKKLHGKIENDNLAHVSYLLRKLSETGAVIQHGERKGATYESSVE